MRGRRPCRRLVAAWLGVALFLGCGSRAVAGPSFGDTVRFLEQATFGPTPELIAHVQQVGFEAFLDEQFGRPDPVFPDLGDWPQTPPDGCDRTCRRDNYSMYPLQLGAFGAFVTSPDQLRLRVAFALNQIFVVSAVDGSLRLPSRMLPYLQVLASGAFGNFRQLLTDITLNPAMGRYLDTVGNNRAAPNENYARELLQLFTIGVDELNPDGTPRLDDAGQRLASYDQTTIAALARVFTGWVFAPARTQGVMNYLGPLVPGKRSAGRRAMSVMTPTPSTTGCLRATQRRWPDSTSRCSWIARPSTRRGRRRSRGCRCSPGMVGVCRRASPRASCARAMR